MNCLSRLWMVLVFVCVAIVVSSSLLYATPIQWVVESGGNGHYYEPVTVDGGITWSAASAAATAQGGYLATITSTAENDFVYGLIEDGMYWHASGGGSYVGPWIGGFQPAGSTEPDGSWQWVTGESFSLYDNWGPEQPNNVVGYGNEDRIHFYGPNNVKSPLWNDLPDATGPSNWYVNSYVIEFVPEPSIMVLLFFGSIVLLFGIRR